MSNAETMPMFPLNAVIFPGAVVPLHVFEDRYKLLVGDLSGRHEDARVFGTVAIREGYEVGSKGAQSVHRVGTWMRMSSMCPNPDGTIEIEAVAMGRLRLEAMDSSGAYLVGSIRRLAEEQTPVRPETVADALAVSDRYRNHLDQLAGAVPVPRQRLPKDPEMLSWVLCAQTVLTQEQGLSLLDCPGPGARLACLTEMLEEELRLMEVVPSLPATRLGRTAWSPN